MEDVRISAVPTIADTNGRQHLLDRDPLSSLYWAVSTEQHLWFGTSFYWMVCSRSFVRQRFPVHRLNVHSKLFSIATSPQINSILQSLGPRSSWPLSLWCWTPRWSGTRTWPFWSAILATTSGLESNWSKSPSGCSVAWAGPAAPNWCTPPVDSVADWTAGPGTPETLEPTSASAKMFWKTNKIFWLVYLQTFSLIENIFIKICCLKISSYNHFPIRLTLVSRFELHSIRASINRRKCRVTVSAICERREW